VAAWQSPLAISARSTLPRPDPPIDQVADGYPLCCEVSDDEPISSFEYAAAKARRVGPFARGRAAPSWSAEGLLNQDKILVST
jgi:hypothetical protein